MKPTLTVTNNIAYKWLSWGILLAAVYYWLFTFGLVLFTKPVASAFPSETLLYRTFARQNWRLFAISKVYNRQMLFITRDKQNLAKVDTTDIVQYLLTEKRMYAPFNNYEDALDRILYLEMNGIETQMINHKAALKKQYPGKPPLFYLQESSALVLSDSLHQNNLDNIVAFGKYMMAQKNIPVDGKECQLIITHTFIPPSMPADTAVAANGTETLFISNYKPL
jgi:hypothetical protein